METTQIKTITLSLRYCSECHIHFGITEGMLETLRNTHETFYCPNGHSRFFPGKSNEEKLRGQISELHGELGDMQESLSASEYEHGKTIRSLRATRGHVTRTKNKIAKGVCPCCDQHFPNLEKHMSTEHPDYVEAEA